MDNSVRLDRLRKTCDPLFFEFDTTEEVETHLGIIGQPGGTQAIDFGLNIDSPGYNIFVLGNSGTGRTTAIEQFIETKARGDSPPDEWIYVYNFTEPYKPIAIQLPPGMGSALEANLAEKISKLKTDVQKAFENEAFRDAALEIQHIQTAKREELLEGMQRQAAEKDAAILTSPEGIQIVPVVDNQPLPPQGIAKLPVERQAEWKEIAHKLEHQLNEVLYKIRLLEADGNQEIQNLIRRVASSVVDGVMQELKNEYDGYDEITHYIELLHADILKNIHLFRDEDETDSETRSVPKSLLFRRYEINILVDHSRSEHAPVIVEHNPTVPRLLGRVEHESRMGGITLTDLTLIRGGAFHAANGGYLVLRAKDLFTEPGAWDALKRVLIGGVVQPDDPAARGGAPTKSLDPQPIPVSVKVVIIGPASFYYLLYQNDEDFQTIFKVMADFDQQMDRTPENQMEYAVFIATLCEEEGLLPFDRGAVARMVEYGSRIADSQNKLTTRFGFLADMVREAHYWANKNQRDRVLAEDVLRGVEERIFRANRVPTQIREQMQVGKQLIASTGFAVGQINSLYVSKIGEYTFGQPVRVTAKTFVGQKGVIQIDREVEMAGPIHNKGVLTLNGYLGGRYAEDAPLSLNAQITFEQSYGGIDGDSASSTELYALISSLANIPITQSIGVTGSVNQLGEIQAIGGVTQKVEGWFELCKERGLTGDQGVMIPQANVEDLMLRVHILDAVEAGQFHIWAVSTVDEGLHTLTGLPASKVHDSAKKRLLQLAEIGKHYSSDK